jgi:hypothetical protein
MVLSSYTGVVVDHNRSTCRVCSEETFWVHVAGERSSMAVDVESNPGGRIIVMRDGPG